MGQYFKPINLTTFEWLYSHDFGEGLKLMEHSYINNNLVNKIMKLLSKGGEWYKTRIVWVGDYSDKVFDEKNLYSMAFDEEDDDIDVKLFKKIIPKSKLKLEEKAIIVNHTLKEYVKLEECKNDDDDFVINPLPLLTAIGNGGGGGDYFGSKMNLIGRWACDIISVEFNEDNLKDYTKITPNFKEGVDDEDDEEIYGKDNNTQNNRKIIEWLKTDEVKKKIVIGKLK